MSKHPDAIGYLCDLSREIEKPWFKMICDLSIVSGVADLDKLTRDTLCALYKNKACYVGIKLTPAIVNTPASCIPIDFLEKLSGFENFKLLGNELEISFKKRISLIFGANGTGKSSLCESLKVLATPEPPDRPLHNVRMVGKTSPTFCYKFKSDKMLQAWSPTVGYGPKRTTIKYFDNVIAIRNVKNAVEPGRIIILSPFRLHVFDYAKESTTKFREILQQEQLDNLEKLNKALEAIRTEFKNFKNRPLATIDEKTATVLISQIRDGENYSEQELLQEKLLLVDNLEKATSEEGLKILKAEHHELDTVLIALDTLLNSASKLWALEPADKANTLRTKQIEQEALAKALIAKEGTLEGLLSLIRAASPLCNLDNATGDVCPLCRRCLGTTEVDLFKKYYDLLAGELENDIIKLKNHLTEADKHALAAGKVDRAAWLKCITIQPEILKIIKKGSDLISDSCDLSKEPTAEAKASHEYLTALITTWATQLKSKKEAIDTAEAGREKLVKQLDKMRDEVDSLQYKQTIFECLEKLRETQQIVNDANYWSNNLPAFTPLLKKITDKAKEAHEDLVVADFETRLNEEYKALAEKNMAAFGVKLLRKGADAVVMVFPQIGGKVIEDVLSEGEQRVHALALFFAEMETCPQSVLVFDDPISSFDYNYTANYCARLRDFTLRNPEKQIIVLTHNWEFFVQLQTTLNQAALDSHLSVYVMENCSIVADYTEKIDELKRDIETVLATTGEPTNVKKEEIAGKMRRLIEAVVNTYVFNNQRHQYKQKSQAITAFQNYTRIVALRPDEATILRDLYAKLSISAHDDPRTSYVNSDKAMFRTRYNQILGVETSIKARIP